MKASDPEATRIVRQTHFTRNLQQACIFYYNQTGSVPTSFDRLMDAQLIFHLPRTTEGSSWTIAELTPNIPLPASTASVDFEETGLTVRWPPEPGENAPAGYESANGFSYQSWIIDPAEQRFGRFTPVPIAELRQETEERRASSATASSSGLALTYMNRSDQMNERRAQAALGEFRLLLQDYQLVTGAFPDSWDAVLDLFQLVPVGYTPSTEPVEAGPNEMAITVESAPAANLVCVAVKPTLDMTYLAFAQYEKTGDGEWVALRLLEDPEPARQDALQLLFSALLPTDPEAAP